MTRSKTNLLIIAGVLVGAILGVLLGRSIPDLMLMTSFVGKLYLNALLFVAALMLFAGAIAGSAEAWQYRQSAFTGPRPWVLSTAVLAAGIFSILIYLLGVFAFRSGAMNPSLPVWEPSGELADYLIGLVPQWLLTGVFLGQFIGVFVLALAFGAVLHRMTSRGRTLASFFSELCGGLRRVNNFFLYGAPLAALLLIAATMALPDHDSGGLLPVNSLFYPSALLLAIVIYATVLLPLIVQSWSRRRLEELYQKTAGAGGTDSSMSRHQSGRPQRADGRGSYRDRYDNRGGDRGRGGRPQPQRGPRPDSRPDRPERPDRPDRPERPVQNRDANSPFAVKVSSDSPFEQPTSSESQAVDRTSSPASSDSGSPQRREHGGYSRERDSRGDRGDRGDRPGRDRDRDRRGGRRDDRRDDRGRNDRRPGGRRPYPGPGQEQPRDVEEPAVTPEPVVPSESRSFEENVFGGLGDNASMRPDLSEVDDSPRPRESAYSGSSGSEEPSVAPGESHDDSEMHYGRSRHRRAPQLNAESDDKPEEPVSSPPTSEETASNEPIEFGRFRRKRQGQ